MSESETYTVTVATGTSEYSGTNNYIYVTLVGEQGESERTLLDNPGLDFCRGADRTRRRRVHGACYSGSRTFACTTVASPLGVAIATRGAVGARTNGAENCITYASVYFTPRGWIRRSCARLPWSAEGAGFWCPLSRFL
uniref:PLAT domain-containing protein n=1 Tax=Knipowitschia caucasica TaxID=637954 RepID=A0AAV2KRM8_KNICA